MSRQLDTSSELHRLVTEASQRVAAARMFRELANKIERGDLDGGRIQWRVGLDHVEMVELDPASADRRQARLLRVSLNDGAAPPVVED